MLPTETPVRISNVSRVARYVLLAVAVLSPLSAVNAAGTATISASSIVCDSESDLPNWGSGSGPHITSTTASDFLATHPNCHAASGWVFQWAPLDAYYSLPDDNTAVAGSPWVATGATASNGIVTTQVSSDLAFVWLRVEPQSGYFPFSGMYGSDVTAEMHCNVDHIYNDNLTSAVVQDGQTYYCVAFNAPLTHALTVTTSGSGSVSASGVNCPGDCSESYTTDSQVTLTATPQSSYAFNSWTGACAGQGSSCVLSMNSDKTTQANFTQSVSCSTLNATPSDITTGSSVTLTWACTTACTEIANSDGFSTGGSSSGSDTATPSISSGTVTYGMTCSGTYFYFPAVSVHSPNVTITASPTRVQSGGNTTISWSSTNTTSCSVTKNGAAWGSGVSSSGVVDTNITGKTIYAITCHTSGVDATGQVIVNVGPAFQEF